MERGISASRGGSWLVFFIGMLFFTLGLWRQEIISFETRFVLFSQDIFRHGIHFFPTIYGEAYPDYPSLSSVLIYLCSLPFGEVTKLSAVLPTAITAALVLVMTYRIANLYSRRWGWYAVAMALLTVVFVGQARTISLDLYVCLMTVSVAYISLKMAGRKDFLEWSLPLLGIAVLLLIGVAFRGPIGLVIPAAVSFVIFLSHCRYKLAALLAALSASLLALSIAGLLWLAYLQGGESLLHYVVEMQFSGRMSYHTSVKQGYYFRVFFSDYLLSSIIALAVSVFAFRTLRSDPKFKTIFLSLILWVLVIFVGMSVPGVKKSRYIIEMVPALALLSSLLWVVDDLPKVLLCVRRLLLKFFFILPIMLIVTLLILRGRYDVPVNIILVCALLATIFLLQTFALKHYRFQPVVMTTLVCVIFVTQVLVVQPVQLYLGRAKDFVVTVEALKPSDSTIYFYQTGVDGADVKYFIHVDGKVAVGYADDLQLVPENNVVIMHARDYKKLSADFPESVTVIAKGRFGRYDAVALLVG